MSTELSYNYFTFPRKGENKEIPANLLGIEVTIPPLAAKCSLGNIDPQHSGGDSDQAAVEAALEMYLEGNLPVQPGDFLATTKADLDSVGVMAIFEILASGKTGLFQAGSDELKRIHLIAAADSFQRGEWKPSSLPTVEQSWPAEPRGLESTQELAAMQALCLDFKVSLKEKVAAVMNWILTGQEVQKYRDQVEDERLALVKSIADGTTKIDKHDGFVVVESAHKCADVGQCLAPVVFAYNPKFVLDGRPEPSTKQSVYQFGPGYADFSRLRSEMQKIDAGWGGSATFQGSVQGAPAPATTDQVIAVLKSCLAR